MPASNAAAKPPSPRWAGVGLIILALALRPAIMSVGPILTSIQQSFGLSYTQASMLTSIPNMCMGFLALLAPFLAKRFGTNSTIIASLVLLGLATALRATVGTTSALLFSTAIIGAGIAIANTLVAGWIKQNYDSRAALFMGLFSTGLSAGALLATSSTLAISNVCGSWRTGAGVWAILSLSGTLAWLLMARAHPTPTGVKGTGTSVKLPWRNSKAWLVALYFGCSQFLSYAVFAWLAPSMLEMQTSTLKPEFLLSGFTLAFTVANFVMGLVAGSAPDRRAWILISTVMTIVGIAGLAFVSSLSPAVFILLIAVGLGAALTLGLTLPLDHTSSAEEANAWTVFSSLIGYLIAAVGPYGFGALRDVSGAFTVPYVLLFVVSLLMLALTPLLGPRGVPASNFESSPDNEVS